MQRISWVARSGVCCWRRGSHCPTPLGAQVQKRWKGIQVPPESRDKSVSSQPRPEEVSDPTQLELFPESENTTWKTFEPPTSLLAEKRIEQAIAAGCDIPLENTLYKLRSSATWAMFDPNISFGIRNKTNPTFRFIFEDPMTGKLRRFKYESSIENKGFMVEAGCRIGTTYVSPPFFQEPIIYSSLPRILTITKGLSAVIGFAQIEVFQVAEYPDYTFTYVSAGFSFGFGLGFIQQGGKITFNHKMGPLEKLRSGPRFVWLSSVLSPVIHIFWVICYITVSSSPILVLLFD